MTHQLQVLARDALELQEPIDQVGGQVQRLRQQLQQQYAVSWTITLRMALQGLRCEQEQRACSVMSRL